MGKTCFRYWWERAKKSPHKEFYFEYRKHAAVRKGDWKIVRTGKDQPWQLYNLAADLSESNNLAEKNREKMHELAAAFSDKQKEWK